MDTAAVYDRLLNIKDDELRYFEDHLYKVFGVSFDHFMFDFDHYTSGKTSRCTRSEKVRQIPTSQVDILDITRFLFDKERANIIEKDEDDDDEQDDDNMNMSGDDDITDLPQPPVRPFLDADVPTYHLERPEKYSHELMSEDENEPAQSESTQGQQKQQDVTEEQVMETTPVYVNSITNNFSTMVINSVVNNAYVSNSPYFSCYESDAKKHDFTPPTIPKVCNGELTPAETELRRSLQRFRHCGSGQDNMIAEHFMKYAIFHGNLMDYPYLKLSPDVGTIHDVALRLRSAYQRARQKRKVTDRNLLKKTKAGLKKLKSEDDDTRLSEVKKKQSTEDQGQAHSGHKDQSQALSLACALPY